MIGIYIIKNNINDRVYIGQSSSIEDRVKQHFRNYKNSNLHTYNYPLYRSIRKYGVENFYYEVLEECGIDELTKNEIFWIEKFNSLKDGYNQENPRDAKRGENSNFSVLTNEELYDIIYMLENSNLLMSEIAQIYGVSSSAIEDINKGRRRVVDGVDYPIRRKAKSFSHQGERQNTAVLTEQDVINIRLRYVNEEIKDIFNDYKDKIGFAGFKKVVYGVTWKHQPWYRKREKQWIFPK